MLIRLGMGFTRGKIICNLESQRALSPDLEQYPPPPPLLKWTGDQNNETSIHTKQNSSSYAGHHKKRTTASQLHHSKQNSSRTPQKGQPKASSISSPLCWQARGKVYWRGDRSAPAASAGTLSARCRTGLPLSASLVFQENPLGGSPSPDHSHTGCTQRCRCWQKTMTSGFH